MEQTPVFHQSVQSMHSRLDIVLWGINEHIFTEISNEISENIKHLEKTISMFDPEAELYLLNKNAFEKQIKVSSTLWAIINAGKKFYNKTLGYFDVSCGSKLITDSIHAKVNQQIPFEKKVRMDKEKKTISFPEKETCLDLGGMGKGIALEKIEDILNKNNIDNVFVSFGGSSILTRGHHPHGDHWPVSLSDNLYPERSWNLKNDCLSISSNRALNKNKTSDHILNPKSGLLSNSKKTAVVISNSPVQAEVLSTALIAAPENEHKKIAQNFNNSIFELLDE